MACGCTDVTAGIATLELAPFTGAVPCRMVVTDWGLVSRNGLAVIEPRPAWLDVVGGPGTVVAGTPYQYQLPVSVTAVVDDAFPLGERTVQYLMFVTVARVDCANPGSEKRFVCFSLANSCEGTVIIPENWIAFWGSRELPEGSSTNDVFGLHVFSRDDPKGTYHMIWPLWDGTGSQKPTQRFGINTVSLKEDPSGLCWLWYVGRPLDGSSKVNYRKVRLSGQTDTDLYLENPGTSAGKMDSWYDPVAGKYLMISNNAFSQFKKVYDDGTLNTLLQTDGANDVKFAPDGQTYYYQGGSGEVRRAPIGGGAYTITTGNIGAVRIQVTNNYVYARRSNGGMVQIRRYDLDLTNPVDLLASTPLNPANSTAFFFAVIEELGEMYIHAKSVGGIDCIGKFGTDGSVIDDEWFRAGNSSLGGPQYGFGIQTIDPVVPVPNRVAKVFVGQSGTGFDLIMKCDPDATGWQTIDNNSTRCGDVRAIVVDNVNNHIYFTNEATGIIYREGLDGAGPISWATGQTSVYGLAIDETVSPPQIYWSTKGDGKIKRADTGDVTALNITDIITGEGTGIRHISLDNPGDKLYWCNATSGLVKRCKRDGTIIETVETLTAASTVCVEPGSGGTYVYFGNNTTIIKRRVKTLAASTEDVFDMSDVDNSVSVSAPGQMCIDPGGLWIYLTTSTQIWRFFHSMSGLNGNTGLTLLNGKANSGNVGIAVSLSTS